MNNLMYQYEVGDGFRQLELPKLKFINQIVISNKRLIEQYHKNKYAVTLHKLNNISDLSDIDTVVLDCRLPRLKSKAYKTLMKLCKGKRVVIIQPPYDAESLSVMMSLLSVTESCKLRVIKYNPYMMHRRW